MDAATFVVVAKPLKEEVVATRPYERDADVSVDDVATTFEVMAVVKGSFQDTLMVLNYQRFTKPLPTAGPGVVNNQEVANATSCFFGESPMGAR
jgi:hypothetical protein